MAVVPATSEWIAEAARLLREGRLVAFPTETVYGLGADATNGLAVASLYEAKGRPAFNPLIAHVADIAGADAIGVLGPAARRLAGALWPGPLTLVVPRAAACPVCELATAGLDTVAIRVPAHPVARALLADVGRPVAAPSANKSGRVSPTDARHVADDFGADSETVPLIIDGGATEIGVESTVIDCSGPVPALLRPGGVAAATIEALVGVPLVRRLHAGPAPQSPGQLESHYAPRASVRLDVVEPGAGEAYLAFGSPRGTGAPYMANLSPAGDLREAAARLFGALRALDATGVATIAVAPIPDAGLGEAINDRLRRAAAPRPSKP